MISRGITISSENDETNSAADASESRVADLNISTSSQGLNIGDVGEHRISDGRICCELDGVSTSTAINSVVSIR